MALNPIVSTDYDDILNGTIGDDNISGGEGNDVIFGDIGNDYIFGNKGNDIIYGGIGNDRISGVEGDDKISGGIGRDILEGGLGKDIFQYESIANSHFLSPDGIIDFESGIDKIDISSLRQIENSYFSIQQATYFSDKKNEMIVNYDKGKNLSTLLLDHDGYNLAEFVITITGKVDPVEDIIM